MSQPVKQDRAKPDTAKYFDLALRTRRIFSGYIAIPIHNAKGELAANCGRVFNDEQIKRTGKYKPAKSYQ